MIGATKTEPLQSAETFRPLDPLGKFGANNFYDLPESWRYASVNGATRNQPILHSSNKQSEHNIVNMPLTPGIVIKVLPVAKFSKQSTKLRSFPISLLG